MPSLGPAVRRLRMDSIHGPSLPDPGNRYQPNCDAIDLNSLQAEFTNLQKNLLSEVRELLKVHHETLVIRLRGVGLDSPASRFVDQPGRSRPSTTQFSDQLTTNVSFVGTPSLPVSSVGGQDKCVGFQDIPSPPNGMEVDRSELSCEDLTEVELEEAEGAQMQVDGAFSSIFATATGELDKPRYHVENLYKKRGCPQRVARSEGFINLTLVVIAVNAVYIGFDADWNKATTLYDAHLFFVMCENAFCLFFAVEWLIRFNAFRSIHGCISDGWFKFDSLLVFMTTVETWIAAPVLKLMYDDAVQLPVGPLRLLRLLRLTRIARLMRFLPELVTMTKGMMRASRAVCSSLFMVLLMTYIFAIVLNTCLKHESEINANLSPLNFVSIGSTMVTLLVKGTFLDPEDVISELVFVHEWIPLIGCAIFIIFILFSAVTVMNMLIGILCEVVNAVGQAEKDESALTLIKQSILMHLKRFDNGDGMITREELMSVMKDKRSRLVLKGMKIDRLFLLELQSMLFPNADSTVSIKGVMELMLMCRGDNPVTVQHIASAQAVLLSMLNKVEERLHHQLKHILRTQSVNHGVPKDKLIHCESSPTFSNASPERPIS